MHGLGVGVWAEDEGREGERERGRDGEMERWRD